MTPGSSRPGSQALDRPETFDRLDTEGVLTTVEGFADQCRTGWEIGRAASQLPSAEGADSIVVLGMGGSGVSGDIAQAVVEPRLSLPWRVIKGYGPLPEWVQRNTLVFAISYSGDTAETLEALEGVHARGARVVAISSGGALAERATDYGIAHVRIPSGQQPRASLGFLLMPLLAVLQEVGLIPQMDEQVAEATGVLGELARRCGRTSPLVGNPAKELAASLFERVPIVYGSSGLASVAAYRAKCDLNEYAQTPAFWNEIPELNHNEIEGWGGLSELVSRSFAAVLLRDREEHHQVATRFEITRSLVQERFGSVVEVRSEGHSALARVLSLVLVTQLAAIYLAISYGIDPGPVEIIKRVKRELAGS